MNTAQRFTTLLLILLASTTAPLSLTAADTADGTLFHLSFEQGLEAVASGNGMPVAGKSAPIDENGGKAAGALDLSRDSESYVTLTYPLEDNLVLREGTVEFWYQPTFSRKAADDTPVISYYLFDLPTHPGEEDNRIRRVGLSVSENGGERKIVLESGLSAGEGRAITPVVIDWQAGEWHHIALTWNREEMLLFLDGIPVASLLSKDGLFGGNQERIASLQGGFAIGGLCGFSSRFCAGGKIDEFRVSSRAYDEEAVRRAFERH